MSAPHLSRRQFLTAGAGGLTLVLIGCSNNDDAAAPTSAAGESPTTAGSTIADSTTTSLPASITSAPAPSTTLPVGEEVFDLGSSLTITDTGLVIVRSPRAEMGQGVLSAIAMIVADELDADVTMLRVVEGDGMPSVARGAGGGIPYTFASLSMSESWDPFRQLGATARSMLVAAAATQLGVDAASLTIDKGVISGAGGSVTFAEIATAAGALEAPTDAVPKAADQRRIVGSELARMDSLAKVTGKAMFASDVRLDGMLVATLARGPKLGSRPTKWDEAAALAVPGVSAVIEVPADRLAPAGADHALAVVATGTWAAIKGREALMPTVTWEGGSSTTSSELREQLRSLVAEPGVIVEDGDAGAATAGVASVDETYDIGFAAHLLMEPLTAVATVSDSTAELWIGHQAEINARPAIERAVGLTGDAVIFHHTFLGTGLGRRAGGDFAAEAVFVAQAVGAPVRIHWTREDDITRGFFRPARATRIRASVTAEGDMVGIETIHAGDSLIRMDSPDFGTTSPDPSLTVGSTLDQPYSLGTIRSSTHTIDSGVPLSIWRAVEHNAGVFALESALSELALAAGIGDLELRQRLLAARPKAAAALRAAVEKSGWQPPTRERAFGMAIADYGGTAVATVVEVVADGAGWKIARIAGAIDCGTVVSPNGLRAQMEGGIIFGLGSALTDDVQIVDGIVQQTNFDNLRPLRSSEIPPIDVVLMPSQEPPTGGGEAVVPTVAPALASAVAALTGERQRSLPLTGWTGEVTTTE
jgi:isoquinoline 1-oxidoreductase subunit beta